MGYPISSNALSNSASYLQRLTTDTPQIENVSAETANDANFTQHAKIASVRSADNTIEPLHCGEPTRMAEVSDYEVRDYESSKSTLWSRVCHFVKNHKLASGIGAGLVMLGALASYKALAATANAASVHQHGSAEKLYVERPKQGVGITVPEPDLHNPVFTEAKTAQSTTKNIAVSHLTTAPDVQEQALNLDCLKIVDTDIVHHNINLTNSCDESLNVRLFLKPPKSRTAPRSSTTEIAVSAGASQALKSLDVDKKQGIEFQKPENYPSGKAPWKKAPDFFKPKEIQIQVGNHLGVTVTAKLNDCKTIGNNQCMPLWSKVDGRGSYNPQIRPAQSPVISTTWFPSEGRQLMVSYSVGGTMYAAFDGRMGNDMVVVDEISNQTSFATLDKNHDGILKATHRMVSSNQASYASKEMGLVAKGKFSRGKPSFVDAKSAKVFIDALSEDDTGNFPQSNIVRYETAVRVGTEQQSAMTFHVVLGGKEYNICDRINYGGFCLMPAGTTELKARIYSNSEFTSFSGAEVQKYTDKDGVCLKATDDAATKNLSPLQPGSRCL